MSLRHAEFVEKKEKGILLLPLCEIMVSVEGLIAGSCTGIIYLRRKTGDFSSSEKDGNLGHQ